MAVSKGNRNKKKKRTPARRRPEAFESKRVQEQIVEQTEQDRANAKKYLIVSIIAFFIMATGFIMAVKGWYLIGYPISFVGAIGGIYAAEKQHRSSKVTQISYAIYCALLVYMWVARVFFPN